MFQIVAIGSYLHHSGTGRVHSKKIFKDMESANRYVPEFKKMCTTPIDVYDLSVLEHVSSIKIIELEVIDTCEEGK